MKGIITAILLLLATIIAQGQSTLYGRAHQYQLGVVDQVSDNIEWIGKPSPVDIIVQVNKGELMIHSEQCQMYKITQRISHKDNTTMYKAIDKKGIRCVLFITALEDYNSKRQVVITIRYSDVAWLYLCTENQ